MLKRLLIFIFISQIYGKTDLYVGYSSKSNNFETVQEAVDKAASIKPKSEDDRITIHIAPGTYRQQVLVKTPYLTFLNDEPSKGEVLLTWYYGSRYKYYSAGERGYYDANLAKKKSSKNGGIYRGGPPVILFKEASYFKAKDIIFENSFSRYMTKEEIEDGVEPNESKYVERTMSLDVKATTATVAASALAVEASYVEFLNCKLYSSQDTLYTGNSPIYFKNCLIEEQTDYICGKGNVVFDSCELRWKGYSGNTLPGYITAPRGDIDNYTGYLLYNCKVTKNKSLNVKEGYFGRPWRKDGVAIFVNTILQDSSTITAAG